MKAARFFALLMQLLLASCAAAVAQDRVMPVGDSPSVRPGGGNSVSGLRKWWENFNKYRVLGGPRKDTVFTVPDGKRLRLDALTLYHYNRGRGAEAGMVTLLADGHEIGSWAASRRDKVYWDVFPGITLEAGSYTIECSSSSTWSYNSGSQNAGFAQVYGELLAGDSDDSPLVVFGIMRVSL